MTPQVQGLTAVIVLFRAKLQNTRPLLSIVNLLLPWSRSRVFEYTSNKHSLDRAEKRLRMRHLRPSRRGSAGKSRLKQQIPNVKSITER